MTSTLAAAAAVAVGGLLLVGVATTEVVLLVAVLIIQVLTIASWHPSLSVPGALGGMAVAAAAALGSDVLVSTRVGERPLSSMAGVLAVGVVASLVHQLTRRDGRERLVPSLAATVTLAALVPLAAAFLVMVDERGGPGLVSAAVVPVTLGTTLLLLRDGRGLPPPVDAAAMVAAAVAGTLAAVPDNDVHAPDALLVAGVATVLARAAGLMVVRTARPQPLLGAMLPFVLVGPVPYVVGRLVVG